MKQKSSAVQLGAGAMAGDWIKMRVDLAEDPAVILIASRTDLEEDFVVGKLHRFWSWADRHLEDGNAPSVSVSWINRYLRVSNFAEAMIEAGWLTVTDQGISIPSFDRHNGQSGKRRALTARRVAAHTARKTNAKANAASVSDALAREEKSIINTCSEPAAPDAAGAKKAPRKRRKPAEKTPRPPDPLFEAIREVTKQDASIRRVADKIAIVAAELRKATPPYTPDEVLALPEALRRAGRTFVLTPMSIPDHIYLVRQDQLAASGATKKSAERDEMEERRRQYAELERNRFKGDIEERFKQIMALNGENHEQSNGKAAGAD